MKKVRELLQQNDHKRGTRELFINEINELNFDNICAIGMFTTDSRFCSQFQNDQRNHKWEIVLTDKKMRILSRSVQLQLILI